MQQSAKDRLGKEKNIKSKLVATRKIIQNKFQKAYSDRIKNEREMSEKYRPITSAIEKAHKQQDKMSTAPTIVKNYSKTVKFPRRKIFRAHHRRTGSSFENLDDFDDPLLAIYSGNNNNTASEAVHSQHHDPHQLSSVQFADEFDNMDGAGPSGATAPQPTNPTDYRMNDSDDDDDNDGDPFRTAVNFEEKSDQTPNVRAAKSQKKLNKRKKSPPKQPAKRILRSNTHNPESMDFHVSSNKRYRRIDDSQFLQSGGKNPLNVSKQHWQKHQRKRKSFLLKDANKAIALIDAVNEREKERKRNAKYDIRDYVNISSENDDVEMHGAGIETEFIPYSENVSYEFYDDPNDLCDRLRLLIASRAAGNTNHAQEINSLIAELRESGYIK